MLSNNIKSRSSQPSAPRGSAILKKAGLHNCDLSKFEPDIWRTGFWVQDSGGPGTQSSSDPTATRAEDFCILMRLCPNLILQLISTSKKLLVSLIFRPRTNMVEVPASSSRRTHGKPGRASSNWKALQTVDILRIFFTTIAINTLKLA